MPDFQTLLIYIIPLLFAITLHEAAHGWVASKLGDHTARMMGRVTLDPTKHIDPIGTIAIPLVLLLSSSGFIFGWAKPVPINFNALRNGKNGMIWVALAGPGANIFMAICWLFVMIIAINMNIAMYSLRWEGLASLSTAFLQCLIYCQFLHLMAQGS